ncbi:MAG TPA: hypothetical protein PLU53_16285, partial [Bacteroidia bacterium]|nr:hypothetical protein [Bacteroidia bacterium]
GNPDEITIREFAEEIIKLTGTKQKIAFHPLPTDDPKQRQPDITRARTILGWEPKIDRAEGLKRTYAYFKNLSPEELYNTAHRLPESTCHLSIFNSLLDKYKSGEAFCIFA